ncbi:hypothetical protein GE09DRAFT_232635 [Coniochaeta sp. 2T2.1]|nr:hypothetical protein GE09DRAFT_232635 [Coniochaeta sp. 2T2.1]
MSESGGSSTILAPLDSSRLESQRLLRPGNTHGSVRLHKRRLNRSSDEENYHIPLDVPQTSPLFSMPSLLSQQSLSHKRLSLISASRYPWLMRFGAHGRTGLLTDLDARSTPTMADYK